MLNFGKIENEKGTIKDLNVSWKDARDLDKAAVLIGLLFIVIGAQTTMNGLFSAGASAYDNAQNKLFRDLNLIHDK